MTHPVGPWNLTDLDKVEKINKTVFSIFSCGGGSTMGYKLSGYDMIGCCEIDPKILAIYKANHNPKFPFLMGIQDFNKKADYPDELYNLDILDGSPPCSSFSMAGSREKAWGKKKKFREGQANQVLDDLFFEFISLAKILQPKVVVAENVKGLIAGKARGYVKMIFNQFREAGYDTQLFLLNSACMGVPQARQRTFFIARRKDLALPKMTLKFTETPIGVAEAIEGCDTNGVILSEAFARWWRLCPKGRSFSKVHPNGSYFNSNKLHPDLPCPTVTATGGAVLAHWKEPRNMSAAEIIRLQTFPDDFNFLSQTAKYVCGMSVPPYMMNRLSTQIYRQLLFNPGV